MGLVYLQNVPQKSTKCREIYHTGCTVYIHMYMLYIQNDRRYVNSRNQPSCMYRKSVELYVQHLFFRHWHIIRNSLKPQTKTKTKPTQSWVMRDLLLSHTSIVILPTTRNPQITGRNLKSTTNLPSLIPLIWKRKLICSGEDAPIISVTCLSSRLLFQTPHIWHLHMSIQRCRHQCSFLDRSSDPGDPGANGLGM